MIIITWYFTSKTEKIKNKNPKEKKRKGEKESESCRNLGQVSLSLEESVGAVTTKTQEVTKQHHSFGVTNGVV